MYPTSSLTSSHSQVAKPISVDTLRSFAFPLNVYATLLLREFGKVDYLHFGVFQDPKTTVLDAQEQASQLLAQLLPGPCKLLEVGIGLGTTLQQLVDQGYLCTGITPDTHQIELARKRYGAALPVLNKRFEDFHEAAGEWRVILFQESGQYINSVDLFANASTLLTSDGEIVWADEFAYRRTDSGEESLHRLDHVIALAQRFGFEVVSRYDCGPQAAPTLDYLLRAVAEHSESLQHDLSLPAAQLDELHKTLEDYKTKYAQGRFGYGFLKFRRARPPAWVPSWIGPDQSAAMRSLFARVFGQEMSQAMWDWKYGQGRGQAIGVWQDGQLVAHYGGLSRAVLYFGDLKQASQSADVMALSEARQSLGRGSPFLTAAATYLEQSVGYGRRHLLGVGFPNERARRAAELSGLYGGPVGRLLEIAWQNPLNIGVRGRFHNVRALDIFNKLDRSVVNRMWSRMSAALSGMVVGVRDADWLCYRYSQHPHHDYQFLLVTGFLGRPLGISVMRNHEDGRCELMDLVVAPCDIVATVEQTLRFVRAGGPKIMFAWVCHNMRPWFGPSVSVHDLGIGIPINAWTEGPGVAELMNSWWLMGGDTDFK